MCKINPKIDFAFKKLFGSENNKDLLISLINSIVNYEDKIETITLMNPYSLQNYRDGKMSILDIKAVSEQGVHYNVEMQIGEDLYFDKRAIYYWSKMVTEQLTEGQFYKKLSKTISINILDFDIISTNDNFHNRYRILNSDSKIDDGLHDIFELHYIELKKFNKDFEQLATSLDRWLTFLNKAHILDKNNLPKEIASEENIIKAIYEVDRMFDEDEREMYDIRRQSQMDFASQLYSAREKGLREGKEEGKKRGIELGMKEGLEQGLEQGIEQGIEAGERQKAMEIAKNLLEILDDETLSEKSGLTINEIKSLREQSS